MPRLEEPDSGHAWTVAFCACVINGILSGMARMVGLLYVACIDHFGVTREEASRPFAVRNAVRYMAGPVTGILGQTFGVRAVTFWGGVIAAAGSAFCAFAPSVEWIVFFWGGIHGLGFALANTLFQVVINQYFERHRASASGLVLSGACLSSLVLPLAIESAILEFGLCGCFLLLTGLFLNVLPPAIVLQSPPWVQFPEAYLRAKRQQMESPQQSVCHFGPAAEKISMHRSWKAHGQQSVVCTLFRNLGKEDTKIGQHNAAFDSEEDLKNLPPKPTGTTNQLQDKLFRSIRSIPLLYLNPVYVLTGVSLATYFFIFLPIVTVIIDYARDKDIQQEEEKFLIYALTFGDLLGRLGFGWVTDRKLMGLPAFMFLSFVCQGVFTAIIPLATTLTLWITTIGLYGVTAGIIFVHIPILVHKYVEEENQSIAIGCVGLLYSIVGFGIPPLVGHFRDNIGSYDQLFYTIAGCSILNGILWLLVPICEKSTAHETIPSSFKVFQ